MAKFYINRESKEIVINLINNGNGSSLVELMANDTDAALEKHVPVVKIEGNKVVVEVGTVAHPMTEAHLIQFIYIETNKGGLLRKLTAVDEPKATFEIASDEKVIAVYEYCNLHGLWVAKM